MKPTHKKKTAVEILPTQINRAIEAALDKKAFDVQVLALRNSEAFTDYFIVCSANSIRQVRAVVDEVGKKLRIVQRRPSHIEGYEHGEWVLMDFFDFVVHVFTPETRHFYDIERLWGNAIKIDITEIA
jgi:ribosome-associated protein